MQVPSSLWILSLFIVIGVGIAAAVLTTDVSIQQHTLVYCIIDVGASLQEHFDWLHSIVSTHALAC